MYASPVRRRTTSPDRDPVERVLQEGAALGRAAPLPYRAGLEQAFGTSLADVGVRVGAADELHAIGAEAATTGGLVLFADHVPPLRTVAHEVAHVLQNRAASAPPSAAVGALDAPAEVEASAAADAVAAGGTAEVSAAPAGAIQTNPLDWFKKKPKPGIPKQDLTDADVVATKRGGVGTANRVDVIDYAAPIGGSGETKGYFKPNKPPADPADRLDKGDPDMAKRAVNATRLDRLLGFGLLPDTQFATHGGEKGAVSAAAPVGSRPLREVLFEDKLDTSQMTATQLQAQMAFNPAMYQQRGSDVYAMSGEKHLHHDLKNPTTQKGLADLQLLDAISGEEDRHGSNILVGPGGQVIGIDNDANFRSTRKNALSTDAYDEKEVGLPSQVDAGTAKRILAMKAKDLPAKLNKGLAPDEQLSPKQLEVLQARMRKVKAHVKQLKKDDQLVSTWDDTTYAAAVANDQPTSKFGKYTSYLQRTAKSRAEAGANDVVEMPPLPPLPPLPALPKRRRQGARPKLGEVFPSGGTA